MEADQVRKNARERMIYESITDEELQTPARELSDGRRAVIQHALLGPHKEELMARIDRMVEKMEKERMV